MGRRTGRVLNAGGVAACTIISRSGAYVNSTLNHLPDARRKIVFDKFHIAKHLSEAVDQVRRRENKQLKARGDDRLAGTRYDWLRHPRENGPI